LNEEITRSSPAPTQLARTTNATETPDLRDYLAPVWRFKWIILALALTVTLATYLYYDGKPKIYQSSTDIYLGNSGVEELVTGTEQTGSERELANQARVLRSRPVAARVAQQIGFKGDPEALLGALQVVADPDADFVTLVAVWSDPQGAARLANAFAQAFLDQRLATRRDDADRALEAARRAMADLGLSPTRANERAELAARISQLEVLRTLPSGAAEQLDRARPSAVPTGPRPTRNAIFAFVLTLALGILAAYGIERLDQRIRNVDEVTPIYDAPVLGTIPRAAEKLSDRSAPAIPTSLRESFRTLRTSLEMAGADSGTLVVTSGVPGEGKSTIVRNLAMAYLESGKEVAIVEADLRRPTAACWLSTPGEPGLVHVLLGDATLNDALHEVPYDADAMPARVTPARRNGSGPPPRAENGNEFNAISGFVPPALFLLPGGSQAADPPTLLGTSEFQLLLVELADRFDVVLIDTPALLSVSDALPLLSEVVGTVLVSRLGATTEKSAEQVADLVGRVRGARLLGVIANDVPGESHRARYGYAEYETAS
jgi:Mrp family chromosome partitioning ATPase/capsular polysaccharide biosynthesis protein